MTLKNILLAVCTVATGIMGTNVKADTFPSQPLRIVVPFGAGGVTDLTARTFGKAMSKTLNQPVIIENRPGAGATIGANHVAKSAPTGYTILLGTNVTHAITPQMMKQAPYDPLKDFQSVATFGLNGNVLLVKSDFPANTFEEFLAYIRAHPSDINYSSGSVGSSAHLAAELLKQEVKGLSYTHIPFGGPAEALSAVIGGHVDFMFSNIGAAVGQLKGGKVKALAVTTAQRVPQLPDVPSIAESGVAGFEVVGWLAAFVPAGTPADITQRLNSAINTAQNDPELRKTLDAAAVIPVIATSDETGQFVQNEYTKWGRVIEAAHIPKL
ncbi:tripartite tricarboxylate transporter substrate binding protein [Alcaligenaceae bacterium]|nr:tripartite tricarboxylate transporter substrate binding protein [Alcaligenaceae bacterium]